MSDQNPAQGDVDLPGDDAKCLLLAFDPEMDAQVVAEHFIDVKKQPGNDGPASARDAKSN